MQIFRRDLLKGVLVLPFASVLGCSSADDSATSTTFQHGVASGDPLPNAVIIWTRVSNVTGAADVAWKMATDAGFTQIVGQGVFHTDGARDFTVKVDVPALSPATVYYYRFEYGGDVSAVGRTKTAPTGALAHLRLAMVSCSSYAHGYFHGYRALAERTDIEAVIHLGDYIYEYGNGDYGDVRMYEPAHEILTLADYRTRHAHYKLDRDLQAVHLAHPFITIWDDHETANDSYVDGAQNHTPGEEGDWQVRKAAGKQAYFEWMPIREQASGKIERVIAFGDLVDLVLLDTRLEARTKQPGGFIGSVPTPDPTRTLLGDEQATWMENALASSTKKWKLLGQQVMVGNLILDPGKQLANLDQWHGYPESRNRFLGFLRDKNPKNVVVLTGDIHSSWANELVVDPNDKTEYDPATSRGSLAVEFVTPAITSPGIPDAFVGLVESARPVNPHVKFVEPTKRGFVILDIVPERIQAAWFHFEAIDLPDYVAPAFATAWLVRDGSTRLEQDTAPAS